MPFPTTGVVDNFNRADENPLSDGGKWTNPWFAGDGNLQVLTNQCARTVTFSDAYRNDLNYGPDTEVFVTVAALAITDDHAYLGLRLALPTSNDGYALASIVDVGTDIWRVRRIDAEVQTQLGADILQEVSVGDGVGLDMVSSTLTVYYRSAGSWSSLGTRTDGTYTAAGKISLGTGNDIPRLDDFGGGTVVVAAAAARGHGALLAGLRNRVIQRV